MMGYALEKMEILPEYGTAIIAIEGRTETFNYRKGDTEGFVNMPLSIKGIYYCRFLLKEEENLIKISLRSHGDVPTNTGGREF